MNASVSVLSFVIAILLKRKFLTARGSKANSLCCIQCCTNSRASSRRFLSKRIAVTKVLILILSLPSIDFIIVVPFAWVDLFRRERKRTWEDFSSRASSRNGYIVPRPADDRPRCYGPNGYDVDVVTLPQMRMFVKGKILRVC